MTEPEKQGVVSETESGASLGSDARFDAQIAAVLARRPEPAMPYGFAARVARAAAAQPVQPARARLLWGPRLAALGALALLVVMLALAVGGARSAHGPWVQTALESLCLAEFVAAVYAAMRLGVLWR